MNLLADVCSETHHYLRPRTTTHDHMLKCNHYSHTLYLNALQIIQGFPGGSDGKESACNTGDLGSIPELGRSPGEGNGNPLQYSCLENPMDGGAWQTIGWQRVGHG